MRKIKASDYIAEFLAIQKTTHVFEVAGGMITHIIDSLYKFGEVNIISMHHEQAAAFAAEAYGRSKRRPGVAMATSGPGATNLLTGIASCYFDSSPALFITGQVNTHEQKGDRLIRQLGFQETDIISMAKPVTKACFTVSQAQELPAILAEAYQLTINGRQGPVLIDIPMNMQNVFIEADAANYITREIATLSLHTELEELLSEIRKARKPLLLAGQGVSCASAVSLFIRLVNQLEIPVVTSLMGLDCIPYDHPLRIGFIGSYGNRWANKALGEADLVINIGSRLDIRQTGADVASFKANKVIFHVDCDQHEINNRVKGCSAVVSDIEFFLAEALKRFQHERFIRPDAWIEEITQFKRKWSDTKELSHCKGINPNILLHQLSDLMQDHAAYTADVGSHQMWAAQSLELYRKQRFITSGGMGAMGFSLPAAIGYSLACNKAPVIVIVGDGSFQMNIQELQTIVRNKLPIKILIMNNQALGMIRQFQDSYFEGRYQSTYWGYNAPDFVEIAKAYKIPARNITALESAYEEIVWFADENGPALLEVMIDSQTNVYPKIAFGRPITDMEPLAKPIAMEAT